jgi:hypothetical protein
MTLSYSSDKQATLLQSSSVSLFRIQVSFSADRLSPSANPSLYSRKWVYEVSQGFMQFVQGRTSLT